MRDEETQFREFGEDISWLMANHLGGSYLPRDYREWKVRLPYQQEVTDMRERERLIKSLRGANPRVQQEIGAEGIIRNLEARQLSTEEQERRRNILEGCQKYVREIYEAIRLIERLPTSDRQERLSRAVRDRNASDALDNLTKITTVPLSSENFGNSLEQLRELHRDYLFSCRVERSTMHPAGLSRPPAYRGGIGNK